MIEVVEKPKQDKNEREILNTFSILLPQMTEHEKERLLAFGEGMVLMSELKKR